MCVSEWVGEWGLGMLLVRGSILASSLNSPLLPLTDGRMRIAWLFGNLFPPFLFGVCKFVDVHVNAWIRELSQQCSITVPLVGAPLGGNPAAATDHFLRQRGEGTHFLSQTHIGKTRGEEEGEKMRRDEPTQPPVPNTAPFTHLKAQT